MNDTAPVRPSRWRRFRVLGALLLLVLAWAGGACTTRRLWRDDRTRSVAEWPERSAPIGAFLDTTTPTTVHFVFDAMTAQRLAELGAVPSPASRWLATELSEPERRLLSPRRPLRLQLAVEANRPPPHWHVPPFVLMKLTPRREEGVARVVHHSEREPATLGEPLATPDFEVVDVHDDGRWLVTRVVLTPGALVVDGLYYALFWWAPFVFA